MIDLLLDIRFRDCDLLGHVNNAVYLTYLEEARARYWRTVVEATTHFPFILAEVTCSYRSPAHYGERLRVTVRVSDLGNKSFKMAYRLEESASGRLVAEAVTIQVMYDHHRQVSLPIPAELRASLCRHEGLT